MAYRVLFKPSIDEELKRVSDEAVAERRNLPTSHIWFPFLIYHCGAADHTVRGGSGVKAAEDKRAMCKKRLLLQTSTSTLCGIVEP